MASRFWQQLAFRQWSLLITVVGFPDILRLRRVPPEIVKLMGVLSRMHTQTSINWLYLKSVAFLCNWILVTQKAVNVNINTV